MAGPTHTPHCKLLKLSTKREAVIDRTVTQTPQQKRRAISTCCKFGSLCASVEGKYRGEVIVVGRKTLLLHVVDRALYLKNP